MKIFDVLTKIFLSPYRWEPGPGPGIGRVAEKFLITGVSAAGCWAVSGPGWSGDVYLCFDPMFVRVPGPGDTVGPGDTLHATMATFRHSSQLQLALTWL